jgi:hypothetical protein
MERCVVHVMTIESLLKQSHTTGVTLLPHPSSLDGMGKFHPFDH